MRRIVLAFVIAASASPAFAVQDRYGPPRAQAPGERGMRELPAGALLDWNGKTAPQAMAPQPAALARPEPIAPWTQRMAPRPAALPAPAAPQPLPANVAPAPAAAHAQPLPPAAAQQVRAQPAPANATRPFAAPSAPPIATAQAPGAVARPRFYSVSRQYGAQPDPIPVSVPGPRGPALTLTEIPQSENLGRTQAPLDDGRANQAVPTPVTRENAAANRISRLGL